MSKAQALKLLLEKSKYFGSSTLRSHLRGEKEGEDRDIATIKKDFLSQAINAINQNLNSLGFEVQRFRWEGDANVYFVFVNKLTDDESLKLGNCYGK